MSANTISCLSHHSSDEARSTNRRAFGPFSNPVPSSLKACRPPPLFNFFLILLLSFCCASISSICLSFLTLNEYLSVSRSSSWHSLLSREGFPTRSISLLSSALSSLAFSSSPFHLSTSCFHLLTSSSRASLLLMIICPNLSCLYAKTPTLVSFSGPYHEPPSIRDFDLAQDFEGLWLCYWLF